MLHARNNRSACQVASCSVKAVLPMSRNDPPRPHLPRSALDKWDACKGCMAGLPCEKALMCVLGGNFEFRKPEPMMHAWPWTDRITKMMCYTHRNTCALRDCDYLHEYHGQLCTGRSLHFQFIRTRRSIQRRVAGLLGPQVRAAELPACSPFEMYPNPSELLDRCDFWKAILEDCQYIGMQERLLYLNEWEKTLLSGDNRWDPPDALPMTEVVRCATALKSNIAHYRADCVELKAIFNKCRLQLSSMRCAADSDLMHRENMPELLQRMPASYWLARHHIASMRESRLFASVKYTITNGMHFNWTLFEMLRAGMPPWITFHLVLLARLWPKARIAAHPTRERFGIQRYKYIDDETPEDEESELE